MGWPRGVSRKGYIKKDGTPHAPKQKRNVDLGVDVSRPAVATDPKPKIRRTRRVDPDVFSVRPETKTKVDPSVEADPASADLPVLHGMVGTGAITEPCPMCMYAYADGGWCASCGWSAPVIRDPYGTHSGRRL